MNRRGQLALSQAGNCGGSLYLAAPEYWARLMRTTLAFNGSYFNTTVWSSITATHTTVRLIEKPKVRQEVFAD